jgi:signal transduction histidine kinase/CheY-like chemotaxis protein
MPSQLRALVDALGDPATRREATHALAQALGARELLLFVQDPELGAFLPAPGQPQTLPHGRQLQAWLRTCGDMPACAELDLGGTNVWATATLTGGCAFVLLAARACEFPHELAVAMPVLAAALRAQQMLRLEVAAAADAREIAARAHELARALDAARAAAADSNRQLQAEHAQKDQFLAMLAHELRNPLAPMTSAVEILRRIAAPGDDRVTRQVNVIGRQLQQLTHLVDDLLDVSRVSRGLIELRRETLPLNDVLAAAMDSSRPLIESRQHTLLAGHIAADVLVEADAVRLTQVFANLLNNSAKYTPPGGIIRLNAALHEDEVEVRITDNGAGIPRDMLASIFDLFTQVPGSLDRAPGGLGIGLTLVRTLVQLHGGQVHAESDGPGAGSTFAVTLPRAAAPARAKSGDGGVPAAPECDVVMIVDDNTDAALSLAEVLRLSGMTALVARDGAEGLALAQSGPLPDVALLDIGLPGMDGYEVAREWRRRFGRATKLIALTGYGAPEDRRRSAQAGFDEHLVKPVALDELLPLLDTRNATADP